MVLSVEQMMRNECKNINLIKALWQIVSFDFAYIFSLFYFHFSHTLVFFAVWNWRSELFCPLWVGCCYFFGLKKLKHVNEKLSINCWILGHLVLYLKDDRHLFSLCMDIF